MNTLSAPAEMFYSLADSIGSSSEHIVITAIDSSYVEYHDDRYPAVGMWAKVQKNLKGIKKNSVRRSH